MKKKTRRTRWGTIGAHVAVSASLLLGAAEASAESQVRIAMTASDIPLTIGQPNQGFEGYRFVGYSLYEELIGWDLSSSEHEPPLVPGLATEWALDPEDNTQYIFKLREGVTFHDGCPFNADNVVWNYERLTNPDHEYFNAQQFGAVKPRIVNYDSIKKIDDYTVAIKLKRPDSIFPTHASLILMISDCALKAVDGDYDKYANAPAGTGPYKFSSMVPRERLTLVKNEDYWNEDRIPKHDTLVLVPMPEATTRTAALMSGQVDFIENPSPDTIPMLQSNGMQIVSGPYPHNWLYTLNTIEGPFKDLRVRQAANYAINRPEIVALMNGYALEGYGAYPPGSPLYGNPIKYDYNPEKAKALLEEAGCSPCKVSFAISTSGSGQMLPLPMNELVKAQLEAVGFEVELDAMDWSKLLEFAYAAPQHDGVNVSRALPDPQSGMFRFMLRSEFTPNGSNYGHYENDEAEVLIDKIYRSFDQEERDAMVRRVHEIMVDTAVMLFVTHDVAPRALSPKLSGYVQAQSWFQDLTQIEVAED